MRHDMKLFSRDSLSMIQKGIKTMEVRLCDEKRASVKLNDEILFTNKNNETVLVRVVGLCHFTDFTEMFRAIDPVTAGYQPNDSLEYCVEYMHGLYSNDEIQKYGVLGIIIKRI